MYVMYRNGYRQHAPKKLKFGRVVLELCQRTDKQTSRHTCHNTLPDFNPFQQSGNYKALVRTVSPHHSEIDTIL